jgi:hypothetical protein
MRRLEQPDLDSDAIRNGLLKGLALSASLFIMLAWWNP